MAEWSASREDRGRATGERGFGALRLRPLHWSSFPPPRRGSREFCPRAEDRSLPRGSGGKSNTSRRRPALPYLKRSSKIWCVRGSASNSYPTHSKQMNHAPKWPPEFRRHVASTRVRTRDRAYPREPPRPGLRLRGGTPSVKRLEREREGPVGRGTEGDGGEGARCSSLAAENFELCFSRRCSLNLDSYIPTLPPSRAPLLPQSWPARGREQQVSLAPLSPRRRKYRGLAHARVRSMVNAVVEPRSDVFRFFGARPRPRASAACEEKGSDAAWLPT